MHATLRHEIPNLKSLPKDGEVSFAVRHTKCHLSGFIPHTKELNFSHLTEIV